MSDFNLNDLFDELEEEVKIEDSFLKIKEGEKKMLVFLPVADKNNIPFDSAIYNDKVRLVVKVQQSYQGKISDSFIARVSEVTLNKDKSVSLTGNPLGITMSRGMVQALITFNETGFNLGEPETNVIVMIHDGKRQFTATPKKFTFSPEDLESANELTMSDLVAKHEKQQEFFKNRGKEQSTSTTESSEEANPWEE